MTEAKIPTPAQVKQYFCHAKDIICLKIRLPIDISYVKEFSYSEADNAYYTKNGIVCVWKNGCYAEIKKKKCQPGEKGCSECAKKKLLKKK